MSTITRTISLLILCLFSNFSQAQQGLIGEYYDGTSFDKKVMTRTDAQINFVWDNVAPAKGMDPERFSIRWKGKIKTPERGQYYFRAHVDDGIRVKVNGKMVIDAWGMHDSERFTGSTWLEAGRYYDVSVEYFNGMLEGEIQLYWHLPSEKKDGKKDRIISGSYFFKEEPPVVAAVTPKPKPKPVPKKKPVTPPAKKPTVTTTQKSKVETPAPAQEVAEAKPEPPAKAAAVPADTLRKYIPKNVLFVKTKPTIVPDSYPELDKLGSFLLRNTSLRLNIAGHTDKAGNPANNMRLSEARAQTVAQYLIDKGIAAERITTKGYGDTQPLISKPHPRNRRVEFIIY